MVDLIERVRLLKKAGTSARILFFDAASATGGQDREAKMANNIAASAGAHPDAVHVILTGNMHSRISPGNRRDPDYKPMGYLVQRQVPGDRIVALDVGARRRQRMDLYPGVRCITSLGGRRTGARWSIEIDDATRPSGHQGWYHVGTLSASVPAVGDFDVPQESPVPAEPVKTVAKKKERKTEPVGSMAIDKLQGSWQAYQNGREVVDDENRRSGFLRGVGPRRLVPR